METQLFLYLAKVNAALLLFYLLYIAVFRSDTFIRFRRIYLLSAIVFALLYPFFSVDALSELAASFQNRQSVEASITIGEPTASVIAEVTASQFTIPWISIGIGLALLVTVLLTIRFLWQITSILKIRCQSKRRIMFGRAVYDVPYEITPFSFFRWIFLHTESHSEEELQQILVHEYTHAKQWHSIDIVLSELLCLFFWWNPAMWLIKREIAINLEYLADNDVLQHGINSKAYQYHLLRLAYHEPIFEIGNNFNVSQLKQRITMMNKTKSPTRKLVKYLCVLPLALLLITFNSCLSNEKKADESIADEIVNSLAETREASTEVSEESLNDEVFVVVENQPLFPGGNNAMMKFLSDNIKYPVEAQEKGVEGRVITNFVVEKDGSLSDFQVVRGIDPLLDAEALRVLQTMPNWKPGTQRGENVRVRFTLPVVFRLQGNTASVPPPPPPPPVPDDGNKTSVPPPPPPPAAYTKSNEELKKTNEIFAVVEKQPEFPGGNNALMRFLSDNINYPTEAQEKGIQGRVVCNFVVERDGSISDVKIVRGVDPLLDKESVRILQSMPKWNPGTQKGEKVRVKYTLPVVFRLQQ